MTSNDFYLACNLDDEGNHSMAFSIFKKLAENGDTASMNRLAVMYGDGIGVEKDIDKSIYWDKKAIDLGDSIAIINLGITFRSIGDFESSKDLFYRSLKSGDPEGGIELVKTILSQSSLILELRGIIREIDHNIARATPESVYELDVIRRWFGI
jgi:TPR repeat protein